MGNTKCVMYVVPATTSHHRMVLCQKWFCSTTLGSRPKKSALSMSRISVCCSGNFTVNNPKIDTPSSAAPRVASYDTHIRQ